MCIKEKQNISLESFLHNPSTCQLTGLVKTSPKSFLTQYKIFSFDSYCIVFMRLRNIGLRERHYTTRYLSWFSWLQKMFPWRLGNKMLLRRRVKGWENRHSSKAFCKSNVVEKSIIQVEGFDWKQTSKHFDRHILFTKNYLTGRIAHEGVRIRMQKRKITVSCG